MTEKCNEHSVLTELKEGNARFLRGETIHNPTSALKRLQEYARVGQTPKAIVLCCSDSRAPVETVFDQGLGDLFVIRVAGNIVAPSLIGSVEFAVGNFKTSLVVVMGHTQCGAVTTTLDHLEHARRVPSDNVYDIVKRIKPHVLAISQLTDLSREDRVSRAVEANVLASVSNLKHSSTMIEALVEKNELTIVGAVLNISTGKIDCFFD